MESRASHSHNKAKACYKAEARCKNQHQGATAGTGGNGSFQVKKGKKSKDSTMQTKTQTSTVTPSTPTTLAPASTTASPATSRTPHDPAATALLITSATILTTEIPDEQAQGTTLTAGTSEHKTKCSTEGELDTSDKNSSKNIHETNKSQISTSTDLQQTLQKTPPAVVTTRTVLLKSVQRATFSQIPRTMSSPKLRSSPNPAIEVDQAKTFCKGRSKEIMPSLAHKFKSNDNEACVVEDCQEVQSVQPLGTQQSKERGMFQRNKDEENRDKKEEKEEEEEAIHKDKEVGCTLKGSELSPGATTSSISQVKETAGKTDESAMSQCEKEKSREWKEGMRKEGREALERRGGLKGNDQEKKTEEKTEKERKGQDKHSDTKNKEMREKEKKSIQVFKSFKDAAVMTEENPVPVQTLDAALQTELLYKDAEIQAVVEVRNKSTSTSPNMTHSSWSQIDPMVNLNNHEKVSGTASISLQNGQSQDGSLDSSLVPVTLASVGSMVKGLSPTHYKSSIFSKPSRQHVCEIQIELCSQSPLSDSLVLPEEKDSQASSTKSGLEMELKQVDQEGDRAGTSPLPEVAWDEQGMTWEVYGAAVDMESLGFAIQNHLQHKIQEHEQRIRHLRKSISISEHSNSDGKGARKKQKKKKNVFWSLFQRPTCCFKTESEA